MSFLRPLVATVSLLAALACAPTPGSAQSGSAARPAAPDARRASEAAKAGRVAQARGDYAAAAASFAEAIQYDEATGIYYADRAYALWMLGQRTLPKALAQRARELDPRLIHAIYRVIEAADAPTGPARAASEAEPAGDVDWSLLRTQRSTPKKPVLDQIADAVTSGAAMGATGGRTRDPDEAWRMLEREFQASEAQNRRLESQLAERARQRRADSLAVARAQEERARRAEEEAAAERRAEARRIREANQARTAAEETRRREVLRNNRAAPDNLVGRWSAFRPDGTGASFSVTGGGGAFSGAMAGRVRWAGESVRDFLTHVRNLRVVHAGGAWNDYEGEVDCTEFYRSIGEDPLFHAGWREFNVTLHHHAYDDAPPRLSLSWGCHLSDPPDMTRR